MALMSMTGFGKAQKEDQGLLCQVVAQSVNRKHLEVVFQMPNEMAEWEYELREVVKSMLHRGRVQLQISLQAQSGDAASLFDAEVLERAARELAALSARLAMPVELRVDALLRVPGAIRSTERLNAFSLEHCKPIVVATLQEALQHLCECRAAEAKHLVESMCLRLDRLETALKRTQAMLPEAITRYREQLWTNLRAADLRIEDQDERLAKELAVFAERSNVGEEIERLASHLQQMRALLLGQTPSPGRKLEFLAQEMGRELNTLAAKAPSAEMTSVALECRVELDNVREQLLNLE
ncbi:MAG: YicC/YloC family endoribonuclease [Verrucomicrobiales bacterium]